MPILAHQGGWDEILMFVAPIAGAVLLIWWLEFRGRRKPRDDDRIE